MGCAAATDHNPPKFTTARSCSCFQQFLQAAARSCGAQFCCVAAFLSLTLDHSTGDGLGRPIKENLMTDMSHVQAKLTAITTAHTDYAKAAFEANKAYMEKLATMKAPDQAMQLTTDHMRTAHETFVAESQKIGAMYKDFFQSAFQPMTESAAKNLRVV
jgi:hypothetical protein